MHEEKPPPDTSGKKNGSKHTTKSKIDKQNSPIQVEARQNESIQKIDCPSSTPFFFHKAKRRTSSDINIDENHSSQNRGSPYRSTKRQKLNDFSPEIYDGEWNSAISNEKMQNYQMTIIEQIQKEIDERLKKQMNELREYMFTALKEQKEQLLKEQKEREDDLKMKLRNILKEQYAEVEYIVKRERSDINKRLEEIKKELQETNEKIDGISTTLELAKKRETQILELSKQHHQEMLTCINQQIHNIDGTQVQTHTQNTQIM